MAQDVPGAHMQNLFKVYPRAVRRAGTTSAAPPSLSELKAGQQNPCIPNVGGFPCPAFGSGDQTIAAYSNFGQINQINFLIISLSRYLKAIHISLSS